MENEYIYSEAFQEYGDKLKNSLSNYVTLETTLLVGNTTEEEVKAAPLGCMHEFLDASLVSDKDTAMKKLFAAGLIMAKDKEVLPFELPGNSPEAIASVVDDGLTRVKAAYKMTTGEIPIEEIADALIDAAAARAIAVADKALDNPEASVEILCDAISEAFPEVAETVQSIKPVIKQLAIKIAPELKEPVHKGINQLAEYAKKAVRAIIASSRETNKVNNPVRNTVLG